MITGNEDSRGNFLSQWKFYCAVLLYGQNSGKKGISSVLKEVDEDGDFQIDHVNVYVVLSTLFADEISKQVCALKVLAISIGKGRDNLIYIYEEYNSVS